jgi:hypothetical protein
MASGGSRSAPRQGSRICCTVQSQHSQKLCAKMRHAPGHSTSSMHRQGTRAERERWRSRLLLRLIFQVPSKRYRSGTSGVPQYYRKIEGHGSRCPATEFQSDQHTANSRNPNQLLCLFNLHNNFSIMVSRIGQWSATTTTLNADLKPAVESLLLNY